MIEEIRRKIDILKTENTHLRSNVDVIKDENTQLQANSDKQKDEVVHLTTLMDKMAVNSENQIQQINSQSNKIAQLIIENKQLKTENQQLKVSEW